jgi:hypothetical protein
VDADPAIDPGQEAENPLLIRRGGAIVHSKTRTASGLERILYQRPPDMPKLQSSAEARKV